MHGFSIAVLLATVGMYGCSRNQPTPPSPQVAQAKTDAAVSIPPKNDHGEYVGFDRNEYPGDDKLAALKGKFAFVGYWVTPPPTENTNTWTGKREFLRSQGWGFLVLADGKLDAQILKAKNAGTSPGELGRKDAAVATAAAKAEGFPAHTIIFLDQEEGGRLLPEQAEYLLAWTEAVAATNYKPGVYASGQLVEDSPGVKIDTIQDIRNPVKQGKLHEVAMFDAQDTCPPAPGCTINAKPLKSAGEPDLTAWQYSQTPRRPEITKSCASTYAKDGSCYPPAPLPQIFLDMDVAKSADPSGGR